MKVVTKPCRLVLASRVLGILSALVAGLVIPNAAAAATYYVATAGNDGNSCTQAQTASAAKRTIAAGLTCVRPGDTLYIRGGTYNERIDTNNQLIPNGSSWNDAPVIAAYPNETVSLLSINLAAPSGAGQSELKYLSSSTAYISGAAQPTLSRFGATAIIFACRTARHPVLLENISGLTSNQGQVEEDTTKLSTAKFITTAIVRWGVRPVSSGMASM